MVLNMLFSMPKGVVTPSGEIILRKPYSGPSLPPKGMTFQIMDPAQERWYEVVRHSQQERAPGEWGSLIIHLVEDSQLSGGETTVESLLSSKDEEKVAKGMAHLEYLKAAGWMQVS
jgi:hypothetical protein